MFKVLSVILHSKFHFFPNPQIKLYLTLRMKREVTYFTLDRTQYVRAVVSLRENTRNGKKKKKKKKEARFIRVHNLEVGSNAHVRVTL